MYKKILVAVKTAKGAKDAIHTAFQVAEQLNASVHMITIEFEGTEKLDTSSIEWMENSVKSSEFENVPEVTFEVIHINPDENLAEKVAVVAAGFEMIVMGHYKYEKIYKFLHESVAEDLICISPCAVMIVPVDCGNAN